MKAQALQSAKIAKVWEVFWRFLALGCVSFGGPAAHIGYFQRSFVQNLKWLDEQGYARLISLSQFLPDPGSSQIGFAIGLQRAGLAGAIAAFLGFTLPSFALMYWLAVGEAGSQYSSLLQGVIYGCKLLAVVVVADAVLTMSRSFCRDQITWGIAAATAALLLLLPSLLTQVLLLLTAAAIGVSFRQRLARSLTVNTAIGGFCWWPLVVLALILLALPLLAISAPAPALFNAFAQAGALVFGGGHVVLPLLQQTVGDALGDERFLLAYAAAQAVPGPMFSLSAFLGADLMPGQPLQGALLATAGIFLPGFLLVLALHDSWQQLAAKPAVAGAVAGINAAVVGLLMAALYQPVFVSAVTSPQAMALAILGLFVLRVLRLPIVVLVLVFVGVGLLLQ